MSSDVSLLRPALDAAQKAIRTAVSDAIDPAASALKGLLRTALPAERPAIVQAQAILQLSRQPLLAAFEKELRDLVEEELKPEGEASDFHDPTDWMSVGLVDEDQFENRLVFERVGQLIGHESEGELRELAAYTGELLSAGWADPARNPLRGQVIATALYQAVEAVTEGDQCRRHVVKELGQTLAQALRGSYRAIVKDFSARGFRQIELRVHPSASTGGGSGGGKGGGANGAANGAGNGAATWASADIGGPANPGLEAMRDLWEKSMLGRLPVGTDPSRAWESSIRNPQAAAHVAAPGDASADSSAALLERLMQEAMSGALWSAATAPADETPRHGNATDADLMRLLRRLNHAAPAKPADAAGRAAGGGAEPSFFGTSFSATGVGGAASAFGALPPTNLIRAHHDELVQAASGEVDHMVIEVVASLFDQILADARVPPEIAREIARLQMPVLRVALRDTSFFSARKHPVRRFINRISTLAAGFGGFDSGPGKELLVRVNALVTEIVEGDFDQVPLYVKKLGELEQFVAANARAQFEGTPAAATLQAKEAEWQTAKLFGGRLHEAYENLPIPDYLKSFLAGTWSQVIVAAAQGDDADPAREKRYRRAAFHLVASIQPKRTAEERKLFLSGLRGLTATLEEGLVLIGWPKAEHDAFFGKLVEDHMGSLKTAPGSDLDHNMLLRQLDAAARTPLPDAGETSEPAPGEGFEPRFTPREARRVGFVDETVVDWSKPAPGAAAKEGSATAAEPSPAPQGGAAAELDLDLATRPAPIDELPLPKARPPAPVDANAFPVIEPPPPAAASPLPPANPAPTSPGAATEPEEPTEGPQLLNHLLIGGSYRMHLKDRWEKVRLTHMNASRTFFLFTHGAEDRGTISMTVRMLGRLCETHRMKAYEDKPLLDRATERLRNGAPGAAPAPRAAVRATELSAA
ncbi:MAG: DUF1631 domain-containing protein [Burkholderiales bacterium]|nr:DUF1631 domain-containing protein [Burkholderiales bacterium]